MTNTKSSTISLSKYSVYSCILNAAVFMSQIYLVTKEYVTFIPQFIGLIYVPLAISIVMLILLVAILIFTITQGRKRECRDELADFNRYKAAYITKFIFGTILIFSIVIIKDFRPFLSGKFVIDLMSIFVILLTLWEFIDNIVFIILEKNNVE